jgi:hypothetical protein
MFATGRSLVQRIPTESVCVCVFVCVCVCVIEFDQVQQYPSTPMVSRQKTDRL